MHLICFDKNIGVCYSWHMTDQHSTNIKPYWWMKSGLRKTKTNMCSTKSDWKSRQMQKSGMETTQNDQKVRQLNVPNDCNDNVQS